MLSWPRIMQDGSHLCASIGWLIATIVPGTAIVGFVLRRVCCRREETHRANARADRAALDVAANSLRESLLQSGHGLILRLVAIARRMPDDHPVRRDLEAAIDRAEQVLEQNLDRVQDPREAMNPIAGPNEKP